MLRVPSIPRPEVPIGAGEDDNVEVRKVGTPRTFDFTAKDHIELMTSLGLVNWDGPRTFAGSRSYALVREGAILELAVTRLAIDTLMNLGLSIVIPPVMVKERAMTGTGFFPLGREEAYSIAADDLFLVGTSEVALVSLHADGTLDEASLPIRYAGISSCFRREAGAHGKDTRGLYRVHQFTKVEMFAFSTPEQSEEIHQKLLAIEEEIFTGLGLTFQVLDIASGDLGGPAYRKYDLEAWMPGREEAGAFGEVTSTSNCTDFQARRLNIRYKGPKHKGTRFVHTLNGTAVAVTRALVAILETYQQADGSVVVPPALRLWVGKDRIGLRK
jgi:seryl-tRNA synthetase